MGTPDVFKNIYPRLGGLHTIMRFCDSLGKLIIDSGLTEILKHAFGGVEKILSGKKYSQKVRAFWLLTEVLLRPHMAGVNTYHELDAMITKMSDKINTAKLWIDCSVHPTLDNQTGHFICVRCFHIYLRHLM